MDDFFKLILLRNIQEKFKMNFPDKEKKKILDKCDLKKLSSDEKKILESFIPFENKDIEEYINFKFAFLKIFFKMRYKIINHRKFLLVNYKSKTLFS